MKYFILLALALLSSSVIAQCNFRLNPLTFTYLGGGYSIRIAVSGIEEVTLRVNQGIAGIDTVGKYNSASRFKGALYFHIFESYDQKEQFLKTNRACEEIAINIYPSKGKKKLSIDEAVLVEKYLNSLTKI